MATLLRILTSANSNFLTYAQGILDGADAAVKRSTSLTYIDQETGRTLVIAGTGFEFQQTGPQFVPAGAQVAATGGTVTSITLMHGNTKIAGLSGFSEALPNVVASLQGGTVQGFLYTLVSLHGPITFRGNAGRDNLPGTFGEDTYDGGPGGDIFNGNSGIDTASYASAKAGITASLFRPPVNTGDAARDIYHDIENLSGTRFRDHLTGDALENGLTGGGGNDILRGGGGDDSVQGSLGNDQVYGDAGNDSLAGGRGTDLLIGGAGADGFVFDSPFEGNDKVAAFDGLDSVEISRVGFHLVGRAGFDFVASANPHAATDDPAFLYDTNDKVLLFDPDGSGIKLPGGGTTAVKPVALFHITGTGAVQESDIHLF